MGFLEVLTVIFIVLKLIGQIDWNWWLILLPTIISVSFYILWFIFAGFTFRRTHKKIRKEFNDDFFKKF